MIPLWFAKLPYSAQMAIVVGTLLGLAFCILAALVGIADAFRVALAMVGVLLVLAAAFFTVVYFSD